MVNDGFSPFSPWLPRPRPFATASPALFALFSTTAAIVQASQSLTYSYVQRDRKITFHRKEQRNRWPGQGKGARPEDASPLMNLQIPYNVVLCASGGAGFRWKPQRLPALANFLRAISLSLSLSLSLWRLRNGNYVHWKDLVLQSIVGRSNQETVNEQSTCLRVFVNRFRLG